MNSANYLCNCNSVGVCINCRPSIFCLSFVCLSSDSCIHRKKLFKLLVSKHIQKSIKVGVEVAFLQLRQRFLMKICLTKMKIFDESNVKNIIFIIFSYLFCHLDESDVFNNIVKICCLGQIADKHRGKICCPWFVQNHR